MKIKTPQEKKMALKPDILKRLVYVKFIFNQAIQFSKQPHFQSSISILLFHDSIDLFLQIAAEYVNANPNQKNFLMDYFKIINQNLSGQKLTLENAMKRLNQARISLKHFGLLPSKEDIESFRNTSEAFLEQNTPIIFGINFFDISLIDLITEPQVKDILINSENFRKNNNYKEALEHLSIAFDALISNYEESKKIVGYSIFNLGRDLSHLGRGLYHRHRHESARDGFQGVVGVVSKIQKATKLLILKIDYTKYVRFNIYTPRVIFGNKFYNKYDIIWAEENKRIYTEEHIDFCFNFIIESALKLQEFDFEIEDKMKDLISIIFSSI